MHAISALSLLALAGSAIAAPRPGRGQPHVVYTTEVYTVVVTANGPPPAPQTYAPEPPKPTVEPPKPTVVYTTQEPPKPQPTSTKEEEKPTYAPAPKPEPTYAAPAPSQPPAQSGYMGTVSEWRAKLGLKDLTHDSTLESNAQNTCAEGNGQMVHKLNPGTMGQVLAPGEMSEFEHIFVGGWLCEIPTLPGLDGVCGEQSKGWTYQGQTGHAEILTSPSYSKIGCACVGGICGCDLA